jgi:hypothetical protein
MIRACCSHGGNKVLVRKPHFENAGTDGRIIFNCILEKQVVKKISIQ